MRVSVDLDPDVAAMIEQAMAERNLTFEQALNDAVRVGRASTRSSISQRAADLGEVSIDLDKALDIAAALGDQVLVEELKMRK